MPAILALAALMVAFGYASDKAGEGAEQVSNSTIKTAIVLGALYFGYKRFKDA